MRQVNEYRGRRKNFGKSVKVVDIPNLIEIQKQSYERFLQKDILSEYRQDVGLQAVFKSVFPIKDFSNTSLLEFVKYTFGEVKYDVDECLSRGMTYEIPLKLTVRLVIYDFVDKNDEKMSIHDIKEQEIYFGTLPLMTERGTFIINGIERVVVSQLHRSPGSFFDHDKGRTHSTGKFLYNARIIPLRGAWLDLEFDHKDVLYVRIDRRRKFLVTLLLKALGYTSQELLDYMYKKEFFELDNDKFFLLITPDLLIGREISCDISDPQTGGSLIKAGKKLSRRVLNRLIEYKITRIEVNEEDLLGRYAAIDIVDPRDSFIIVGLNQIINSEILDKIRSAGVTRIPTLFIDSIHISSSFRDTLELDKVNSTDEAIIDIYRKLRPANPPTLEVARIFLNNLFFNLEYYDLSAVGRLKLNLRLGLNESEDVRTLRREDILRVIQVLIELKDNEGQVDDIDHLGNRRVRAVGELLENQYRIGLVRMERVIKERMNLQEVETLMPHDLINSKPVSAVVKEFFGTSQLSQFMDQTNPLSEVTHKRRLNALGPGGLTRERAGFEVRDVHSTHYGRICPIETPEGPNIGLIVSLSTYAKVNEYGFIETPYRVVIGGNVTNEVHFLSALEEGGHSIAQANAPIDINGFFQTDFISVRRAGEFMMVGPEEVDYMDVSPNQLVSVAASLIPFLENDDANRALMGSNMQRQAVPLLAAESPLIGTGIERVVARDSGVCVVAEYDGIITDVDASRIVVRYNKFTTDNDLNYQVKIYKLIKFRRSNQNTCNTQKPIVKQGQRVKKGQILADGPAVDGGELALGRNVMVAFMSWGGYNYEDSILVSERIVKEDIFTSGHIEEFEVVARDTKLGKEEITRDIPNVSEEALKNLDDSGIIRLGAEIKAGDILVGKITPKGETQLSPEEKLLRAIFGEKAGDVKDTSLRVPPGVEGIIIDARVFSRKGIDKDKRSQFIENSEISGLRKDEEDEINIIYRNILDQIEALLIGQILKDNFKDDSGKEVLKSGIILSSEIIQSIPINLIYKLDVVNTDKNIQNKLKKLVDSYIDQVKKVRNNFLNKIEKIKKGTELPPGVIKMVKVYIAMKRKLSVGDKMSGRHGNKGVVSRILPVEDMPYFEDGTPVDIVLNPLGVPSRMNVGQVLETHLGWASIELGRRLGNILEDIINNGDLFKKVIELRKYLGKIYSETEMQQSFNHINDDELVKIAKILRKGIPIATPVFDGCSEQEINNLLKLAGVSPTGQARLIDGRTGEPFDRPITVGAMYMLKLHHLVDDKIHARSIGPYSLVTQQPLGGKAQFGGQRLGEMEVWAMEAYGAAYSLQEFLTVKSDDVAGRTRMYEKIVKGENNLEAGLPESFNVLVKELQALCLDIELVENK